MKEIDLKPYDIGENKDAFKPKKWLSEALLSPVLKLGGLRLLEAHNLANRVLQNEDGMLLVEDKEYKQFMSVTNIPEMAGAMMGFGINEVEMIRRILEAPDVEVEKK